MATAQPIDVLDFLRWLDPCGERMRTVVQLCRLRGGRDRHINGGVQSKRLIRQTIRPRIAPNKTRVEASRSV